MSRRFAISFRLTDLNELLATWQYHEQLLGGLFWLSDGLYWLELDGEIVPQAHPDWVNLCPDYGHPAGIEYQVLRFFADIGEALGRWLNPVPPGVADALRRGSWTPWQAALHAFHEGLPEESPPESPDLWQLGQNAERWWRERRLDTGYLRAAPELTVVSTDAEHLELTWDTRQQRLGGVLVMVQSHGTLSLPRPEFMEAIAEFRERLAADLTARIQEAQTRSLVSVEQATALRLQLETWLSDFDAGQNGTPDEDWSETLAAISTLEPLIGPLF